MADTPALSIPQLFAAAAGAILLTAALKNKNPIDIVKESISKSTEGAGVGNPNGVTGTGGTTGTSGQASPSSVPTAGEKGTPVAGARYK